jgi:hypothetical protein
LWCVATAPEAEFSFFPSAESLKILGWTIGSQRTIRIQTPDTIEWNVYAKTHPTKYPAQWDQVLFYETETTITGRYRPGAKALVRAARVCGGIERRAVPIDGFDYQIPCDCHRLAKRNVPYAEVFELIPRFVQPKGWLWISSQEYFTLLAAMKLEEL